MSIVLPTDRPPGLHLRSLRAGTRLWRLDDEHPATWSWDGFADPVHRFDPASGRFRTRYAGRTVLGTARERYRDTGCYVEDGHRNHHLVELVCTRPFRYLNLRSEVVLDLLGMDDRINTSHEPDIWQAAHQLADAVRRWWNHVDGIVYRSRTTPQTSSNVAFWSTSGLATSSRRLCQCSTELDALTLKHRFTIAFDYPSTIP